MALFYSRMLGTTARPSEPHPEVPARSAGLEGCWPRRPGLALRGSLRSHLRVRKKGRRMAAFVYMLQCADGSYYVGSARGDDLSKRIAEHETGAYRGYTFTRRPVRLVWSERFDQITDAIAAERQIKGWSRAKKEGLIRGDWTEIQLRAKRRAGKPKSSSS
jgi:putative endonuclease